MFPEVKITQEEYNYLIARDRFLTRLEAAGVDNWEGYSEGYDDEFDEDEEDIYDKA